MTTTSDIRLYRVAHGKHLVSLVARGLLCRRTVQAERIPFQTISNEEIEDKRAATIVPCGPGGTLHDYVPFHFGPRSPMMSRISYRNLPAYTEGQRPLVYLVTSVAAVTGAGLRFTYTDGHPLAALSDTFDDADQIAERVDLPLMRERYWKDTEDDPDRERRRQAEFLVHDRIPWEVIEEIGVMDAKIKARVEGILSGTTHVPPVTVRADWYYKERKP